MDASSRLKSAKKEVLDAFDRRVREILPEAQRFDPPALIDSLPDVLDRLIEALAHDRPKEALQSAQDNLAESHGLERAFHGSFTLDHVITEYDILRTILFEILEAGGPLSPAERETLTDAMFIATRNAATAFARTRESKQQAAHARLKESHTEIARQLNENAAELAVSREMLNAIHQGVQDYSIFTVDPNGIITTWNQGAMRMNQYTAEEAIGRHFSMLYPEDGRARDEPMGHLRVAAIEGRFRGEGMRIKKSGEPFLADVLITAMFKEGTLFGFCKIVQDLSERNQLIQERDITHTQLLTLQTENDLRERFVFTLSHDLRNPLSAALASNQLIARTPCDSDRHRDLATRSIQSIQRVDRMVTDLLDASRIKVGEKIPIQVSECDLRRVLDEVHDELRTIHGSRFLVEGEPALVGRWDGDALKRVIENLASNAIKYGNPATPVTLALHRADTRVHLKVHNYGPVIRSEEIVSLFEPFTRTRDAQTSNKRGWGLGLTLVRGIAEAHGGMVKVESYPKSGTTFTVDLPRDTRAAQATGSSV